MLYDTPSPQGRRILFRSTTLSYPYQTSSPRRFGGIAFVVLLHVAIIYALVNGLGSAVVDVLRAPLKTEVIQDVQPPPEAPPPSPPPVANVTTVRPPAPTPVARPPIARAAGLDPNQSCTAPEYPEQAEDMGQTGTTLLQFLIGANGSGEQARIATSSVHDQLDQAALQALSACKFKPALNANGQPQEAWTSIPYVWTLN